MLLIVTLKSGRHSIYDICWLITVTVPVPGCGGECRMCIHESGMFVNIYYTVVRLTTVQQCHYWMLWVLWLSLGLPLFTANAVLTLSSYKFHSKIIFLKIKCLLHFRYQMHLINGLWAFLLPASLGCIPALHLNITSLSCMTSY